MEAREYRKLSKIIEAYSGVEGRGREYHRKLSKIIEAHSGMEVEERGV